MRADGLRAPGGARLSAQGGHASLVQPTAESCAADAGDAAESDLGRRRHVSGGRRPLVVLDRRLGSVLASGAGVAARGDPRLAHRPARCWTRRSAAPADAGLIFHSDRGSEFQGTPVRARLAASGVRQSMTRGGAPGENAHMESFFHSLKADVIHGRSFQTVAELRQQLRRYVRYYNYQRLHSSLGYQSPVDYERRAA